MIVGEDDFVIIVGKGAEHAGDGGIDAPDIRLFVEAGNEDRDLGPIIVDAMSHAVIRSWLRIADTVFSIPSARLRAAFQPISDCARSGAARSSDGVRPGCVSERVTSEGSDRKRTRLKSSH